MNTDSDKIKCEFENNAWTTEKKANNWFDPPQ